MTQKKKKRPADVNQLAASIIKDATEPPVEEPIKEPEPKPEKNPAAVALGRLGGKKGGVARAKKLSPAKRKAIAKKAAQARWGKKTKK
ncbi:MAG: hypothetical protein KAR83_02305 [Thermodesulfovibrionales bacterium]|nr:hypothetical protein [Thermodesulfovibrionales bacterium]